MQDFPLWKITDAKFCIEMYQLSGLSDMDIMTVTVKKKSSTKNSPSVNAA